MASEKQTTNIPDDGVILWARSSTDSESVEEVLSTSGAAHSMSIPDLVLDAKTFVAPTIKTNSGATSAAGTWVEIDLGAAAGSRHIEAASPTEADTYAELVGFEFAAADDVRTVFLGLSYLAGTTLLAETNELVFTVNGDIAADATKLREESEDIGRVLANEIVRISGTSAITRVAVIAKNNGETATVVLQKMTCEGYKND